jgi:hypothetical protein
MLEDTRGSSGFKRDLLAGSSGSPHLCPPMISPPGNRPASNPSAGALSIVLILALTSALLLVVLIAMVRPGSAEAAAGAHPLFSSLFTSSQRLEGHTGHVILGAIASAVMVAVMTMMVVLGMRRPGKPHAVTRWIIAGFAIYGLILVALVGAYRAYAGGTTVMVGGFPLPTALLVYGVWLFPWFFVLLFVITFDRSVFSDTDQEAFDALVRRERPPESDT